MFEDIVTSEIVNPTDWALTSQKQASLSHFCSRGKYAIHAAATVHMMLAAVAVSNLLLGIFSVIAPPMTSAMIWTASPTDLSSVVLVVENPISSMMIVENELTTPFGIAAAKTETKSKIALGSDNATIACLALKVFVLTPVSLPATLLIPMIRSVFDKKNALEGASGRTKIMTAAQRHVTEPRM
jgi:hypothetical protein